MISSLFLRTSESTQVPYSFFRTEVQAGNVTEVTAVDDAIDGRFKKPVTPPTLPGASKRIERKPLERFSTHRPAFAADDKLFDLLASQNVTVSA